jgi:transcriptional regulator with XRE-family HTH domain
MGLTQAQLAEKLNVSPQAVSNWERGETLPDVAQLLNLAEALHCSVDGILSGGAGCGGYRRHITVAQMQEALAALDERDRQIIRMRFGLPGGREYTQKEVADAMGISQSYISRLEKRIIERLRREMLRKMEV